MKINDFFKGNTLELDWEYIMSIPEFKILETTEQSPKWHGEGNVMNHTKKCLEYAFTHMPCFTIVQKARRFLLAVLFHDIGKGTTTAFTKGSWHSYGHEMAGEKIARRLLWDIPINDREYICALIRWHMDILNVFNRKDYIEEIIRLANMCDIDDLIALKRCDCNGSQPIDATETEKSNLQLNYIQEIVNSLDYEKIEAFPSVNKLPWQKKEYDSTVYVMIGLPGAGKDTYIKENLSNTTSISRDDIRIELGYCKEGEKYAGTREEENSVSTVFNTRLKECLDKKEDVVINNINLKKEYRDAYKKDFACYNIKWVYIYVEAPSLEDNFKRRDGQIPKQIINGMIEKLDWPRPFECNYFFIKKQ